MGLTAFWDFWNLIDKAESVAGNAVMLATGQGWGVHLDVLPPSGLWGIDVERMLRRYGVRRMWGRRVTRDSHDEGMSPYWIAFDLPRHQSRWARYLLQRYGCQVEGRQDRTAQRAGEEGSMPVPWSAGGRVAKQGPAPAARKPERRAWWRGVL